MPVPVMIVFLALILLYLRRSHRGTISPAFRERRDFCILPLFLLSATILLSFSAIILDS